MFNLLPPLSGMHVLVVHFPIALLFVAPMFWVLAFIWKPKFESLVSFGGILLVLGSAAALLATLSGEAAEDAVKMTSQIHEAIEEHAELGEITRSIFLGLAGLFVLSLVLKRMVQGFQVWFKPVVGLLLVGHLVGLGFLAKAAHEGGKLVHQLGVHAPMNAEDAAAGEAAHNASKGEGGEKGEGRKDDD